MCISSTVSRAIPVTSANVPKVGQEITNKDFCSTAESDGRYVEPSQILRRALDLVEAPHCPSHRLTIGASHRPQARLRQAPTSAEKRPSTSTMFPPLPTQLPHPPRGMLHPGAMRMPARPYRPHGLYGPYGYPNRVGYGFAPHPYPPRGAPPLPVPRPPFTPKQVLSRPAEKGIPQVAVDKKTEKKPSRTAIETKEEQKETRQRVETCTPQQLEKVVVNDAWARYASSGNETDSSKASVWMVSPEDLAGMMNHEGAGNLRAQRGIKAGSSSSDSRGSLKKYFGLPFLHEFRSDGNESDRQPLERATCDSDTSAQVQSNVPGVSLDYRKLFGPGQVTTPFTSQCFQPQKYYDELIPTYGDLEQIPPHMSWRPGDWKCAKCGNHNFSYRGLCKRCREGRFEDAGFVFPLRL